MGARGRTPSPPTSRAQGRSAACVSIADLRRPRDFLWPMRCKPTGPNGGSKRSWILVLPSCWLWTRPPVLASRMTRGVRPSGPHGTSRSLDCGHWASPQPTYLRISKPRPEQGCPREP